MKKYEVINPSDECYIYADDVMVACIANIYASGGYYGLHDAETGESVCPILAFGGLEEWLKSKGFDSIEKAQEWAKENAQALCDCLNSIEYARERTSLNYIGKSFKANAENIKKTYLEG